MDNVDVERMENAAAVEGGMEGYLIIDSGDDGKATPMLCRDTTLFRGHVRLSGWRILPVGTFACWDGEYVFGGGQLWSFKAEEWIS